MLKITITLIFTFVFSLSFAQKEAQTLKARQIVKESIACEDKSCGF